MIMTNLTLIAAIMATAFMSPESVFAETAKDPYSVPEVVAVENKLFEPSRELNFQIGILPLDAFYKALLLSAAYTHYFESYWGWEVVNGTAAITQETNLRSDLRDRFGVRESSFLDYIRYSVVSNLVYTPIYNKNLLFNERLIHGEISFLAGGGMVAFTSGQTAPMFGGGLIWRFFSSESWSFKFDNRFYYHLAAGKSTNYYLAVNIGAAFEFDPDGKSKRRLK